ncbi:MAG TPA: hypothetical protein VHG30_01760 [Microvirga sp.]|nr:hypothetical protein [Microvirga sp.]
MAGKDKERETLDENLEDVSIERPRLTPQGRTSPDGQGQDSTNPMGDGAKSGQGGKAEG